MRSKFLAFALALCGVAAFAQSPVIGLAGQTGSSSVVTPTNSGSSVVGVPVGTLPTFGHTAIESSSNTFSSTYQQGYYVVAPASGTYTTFHIYCSGTGSATDHFGVYNTSAGSVSGQLLIAQSTVVCPATAGWVTGSISVPVISGQTYFMAGSGSSGTAFFLYRVAGGSSAFVAANGAFPSTAVTWTAESFTYSMYLSQ